MRDVEGQQQFAQKDNDPSFTVEASSEMCYHCFDVLIDKLQSIVNISSSNQKQHWSTTTTRSFNYIDNLSESIRAPLFVTWDKCNAKSKANGNPYTLRGCIGTLSPRNLKLAIGDYAITAALRDRRFDPITYHELPRLRVAVSLLVKYEECQHVHDWEVGLHGIIIQFTTSGVDGKIFSATYLPEVAIEQKWDQIQTVDSLIGKAGYTGLIDDGLLKRITCKKYQSSKFRVSYQEYVDKIGFDPMELSHFSADNKR